MISVALVGPDGTGKTTIAKRVAEALPIPARYLYMGDNPASANRSLPTTRLRSWIKRALGHSEDTGPPPAPRTSFDGVGPLGRTILELRGMLRMLSQLSEEWYRAAVGRAWQRAGLVVIRDRDFFVDYFGYDIAGTSRGRTLARSLHGSLLKTVYPRPDLVICLDAPPEVLLERKGEGTIEALSRRAADYRAVAPHVKRFVVVDASRPESDVASEVAAIVGEFAAPAPMRRHPA